MSTALNDPPPVRGQRPRDGRLRCLIVGAGAAGRVLARDLRRSAEYGLTPVGFLDDGRLGERVAGLPVLGPTDDLERVALATGAEVVVVAIPSLPAHEVRRLSEAAAGAALSVRFLPSFGAAVEREARVHDLRRLRVNELLGRPEAHVIRSESRAYIRGRRVLVTGAGGSIGSELCRQVRALGPSRLFLLDHDESNLHRLQLELTGEALLDSDELVIADIRDHDRIRQLFSDLRPEVVFHAAAHKHLPLLERHPCEGVKSNVAGTRTLVENAVEYGAERMILVSTDKAADPTSVLGATKRVAEMVVQAHSGLSTRLGSVRFGNVLGSRGSLLTILSEQIENGDCITVTDPDVERFFMTVEEAVGLVIEAGAMADRAETFVLDMGRPVRIIDLVRNYAAQFHLDPDRLPIRYTGLRPGEKLSETLVSSGEHLVPTGHPKVNAVEPRPLAPAFGYHLERLIRAAAANREDDVRRSLRSLITDYLPSAGCGASHPAPYPDDF